MAVREKLGEILIKEGLITEDDFEQAMEYQRKSGGKLGDVLIAMGFITEKEIAAALGKQLGIPYISIASGGLKPARDQSLEKLITEETARKYMVLPISRTFNSLSVAVVDPLDFITIDNLKKITNCDINSVITTKAEITQAIDEFYGPRVGIPAYALASLVAYRMMDTGDHWGSDVVFGATLGWVVGHTIASKHKQLELAGFKVLPYTAGANGIATGVSLIRQF